MKTRKTFDVKELKNWVNERLALDNYSCQEKYGMINTLDHVLNVTGNYQGFCYLDSYDSENWSMEKDVRRRYY
ncbi:hypothetical protein SCRM01_214 [Synechococcus phage S-CRM01]|uniref:hypothetical protein n=1 Tax=Synechococcus phage S-CRM01 TaxID=1026955 RepID=UPI000209E427|nr:hypothetical protein SCRM01_214 [Synechococcus phage S-CRM01]AEC53160.1 hypothetical protein SCRM01_214 [Synechococcus phage S-CRM01]